MQLNKLAIVAVLVWTLVIVLAFISFFDPLGSAPDPRLPHASSRKLGKPIYLTDCSIFPQLCELNINECTIDRRKAEELTWHEFKWDYIYRQRPVILEGGVPNSWKASKWKEDITKMYLDLAENRFYYDGEFHSARYIWESFDHFENYNKVDPRELSQAAMIGAITVKSSGIWWQPPEIFSKFDIFPLLQYIQGLLGFDNFYENHWLILGPTGAGTTLHKDYYDTSFMNACVLGSKFWVVIERDLKDKVGADTMTEWENLSNHEWFLKHYPRLRGLNVNFSVCRQNEGDIIWVPSGFYHQTVNIERAISVSTNFISLQHLDRSIYALTYPTSSNARYQDDWRESLLRSIYGCVALRLMDETLWTQTSCGSHEFPLWMDKTTPVASYSNLDYIKNSEYYQKMMERAGPEFAKHTQLTPLLSDNYRKIWSEYVAEKESERIVKA